MFFFWFVSYVQNDYSAFPLMYSYSPVSAISLPSDCTGLVGYVFGFQPLPLKRLCSGSSSHLDLLRVGGRVGLGSPRARLLFLPLLLLLLPLGPQISPWTPTDNTNSHGTSLKRGLTLFDTHSESSRELTLATIATTDS